MAPLENGAFRPASLTGDPGRPIDSLMRALLYLTQQVGRPVSEADVRRLVGVPAAGLDEHAFLLVGKRLGLEARALDLAVHRLDDLPIPFALVADARPACVVVAGRGEHWVALDVAEGRAMRLSRAELTARQSRWWCERSSGAGREAWWRQFHGARGLCPETAVHVRHHVLGLATPPS